ncbi:beta-defensin 134 [Sus scrofa]|uniref:Defensin beta 134 n=1 Tax=Sus scrofa TaxID=9823 RepID=A0A8D0JFH0_PIG|nr:beta-defensin 134 [Sus scrofa]
MANAAASGKVSAAHPPGANHTTDLTGLYRMCAHLFSLLSDRLRQPCHQPPQQTLPAMKPLLLVFVSLFFWDPVLAGLNPLSSELHKTCYKNGTCRFECYGSEMLVAYCLFQLECCIKGNPDP